MNDFREFQDGELVPGTRYRVARLIGAGGMGRVYEVEHVELGKRFVLKALQRELARREDLVQRLRNEWRALARLEHPSIVSVTDAGTSENGVPFYVMERLEGENLATLLHRARRLFPQQALAIAAGVLEGLHAAHQIGIVHRDVKPPNIFLTGPTTVKVLDFGIAKIHDVNNVITARGMAVGTPRYMSPEQANGTPVDARSDIYATGLILFEMVTGVGPFDDARDANELLLAQLGRKAPLLSSVSVVAPELDALVAGMLAKDPRERPADACQVAEALRSLSSRYERYVGTDVPTVSGAARPQAVETPTRAEGRRASQPAPAPATRPDGVAARGSSPPTITAVQSQLELETTAVPHSTPRPASITQRMPDSSPPVLYGPDTLVDSVTSAPTAASGPAERAEHTEMLLVVPPAPGGQSTNDAGATRTAVPLAEAPNLTPPPVVPTPALPPVKRSKSSRAGGVALTVLVALLVLATVVILRTPADAPVTAAEPPRAAAAPVAAAPVDAALRVPERAAPEPPPAAPAPVALPPVASAENIQEKSPVKQAPAAKKAAPAAESAAPAPPKAPAAGAAKASSLPASGL